jgi:hypothetical protein
MRAMSIGIVIALTVLMSFRIAFADEAAFLDGKPLEGAHDGKSVSVDVFFPDGKAGQECEGRGLQLR